MKLSLRDLSKAIRLTSLFGLAALSSCSLLVGINDKQCKVDADCQSAKLGDSCEANVCVRAQLGDGGMSGGICSVDNDCRGTSTPRCLSDTCVTSELAEQWLCSDDTPPDTGVTVRYSFKVVDFLSREAAEQVVVKACRNNDVSCMQPVKTYTDADKMAFAQFDLPYGFNGFFDIKSTSLPALLYVTKPIVKDTQARDVPVLSELALQATAAATEFEIDKTKGLALLEAVDCSDKPAGGVAFKASVASDQFYLVKGVPNRDVAVTEYDGVDGTADGGFINLAPGYVTFNAHSGVDGPKLGSFYAQVRANTITFIELDF